MRLRIFRWATVCRVMWSGLHVIHEIIVLVGVGFLRVLRVLGLLSLSFVLEFFHTVFDFVELVSADKHFFFA